jgi:hypothetical protein
MIEELVEQAAAHSGLSVEQANTALCAALFLIRKHADQAKVDELFAQIPGCDAMAEAGSALAQNKSGGLMANLMSKAGGSSGAAMSDAMAMNQQMTRQGITVSDMQRILPLSMTWVQAKTGDDLLRGVLASIPGLGPLLTAQA